jgi:putative flippase GtrA
VSASRRRESVARWLRFLISGGLNTGLTYALYLALNQLIPYQAAYLVAYATGIVISYLLNARFVFRVSVSFRGLLAFPLVYVVQFLVSASLLALFVELDWLSETIAPLAAIALTIPVTYAASKFVLRASR